ncbi:MAG: FliM/FliN family flagellar motor switch protein [Pyrinomonadaceae bacterium]
MLLNDNDPARLAEESRLRAANEAVIDTWRDFLDMSLGLSLELGRTKLTARAILALEVNSIVQLAGSTGEGVEVLAGNRRLARGEIIMIEDRTGVRVNEVIVQEHK